MAYFKDLLVTGKTTLLGGVTSSLFTGNLVGGVADKTNNTNITTFNYGAGALTSTSWIAVWNSYELRAISPAKLRNTMGLGDSTGALAVANGGTEITSNPSMLTNLGSTSAANVFAASPRPGVTGTLPIANGGTGATTAATARTNLGITLANLGAAASSHTHSYLPLSGGTLTGDITINVGSYPKILLTPTATNGSSKYSKAYIEGGSDDKVALWIDSDKTTDAKSRRGLVVYGWTNKSSSSQAVALRQCDTSGTWLTDEFLYHTGNVKYYASINDRPTTGTIGDICLVAAS